MNTIINGRNYWVEDVGEGPVLLLLHGFTGSTKTFDVMLNEMLGNYRIIRMDLPGHGCTGSVGIVAMEQFCHDLAALFGRMNIEKASILGYSLGGRTALSFAVLYPHLINRLILESASPGLASKEEQLARQANDQALAQKLIDEGIEAFVSYWERIPLFRAHQHLPEDIKVTLRRERLEQDPQGLADSLLGMGTGSQPSWWDKLPMVKANVMLVTGEEDSKFQTINQRMAERLPHVSWIEVENAGHTVHLEKPKMFAKIVEGFMLK